ncbi:MAG: glutamyl-Q tRNA(Asp) synthetase [Lysobacteraceae bacterium]|nr:MAG: glutamyl-Q tRNA(Asp) synthetase [Xanthomonadaceae bacterium]
MSRYVGRFAPSPTGPLHLGSLLAAVGSFVDARQQGGLWRVRIEDVDKTRARPGVAREQLATLKAFGMNWDGEVERQSDRDAEYQQALDQLAAKGMVFDCGCTRAELPSGQPYPGTCSAGLPAGKRARAVRCRVEGIVSFDDRVAGNYQQDLRQGPGAFVLRRADGLFAYQLAVVVDDARQGITDVVRGADLIDSTPRQIHLQRLLGLATPRYAHLPLVLGTDGKKLSKSLQDHPVDPGNPMPALKEVWARLGQKYIVADDVRRFWQHAIPAFDLRLVPNSDP